jgi:hypothetical protein
MNEPIPPRKTFGAPSRGITQSDVSHSADTLLRSGERPTIEKIRAKLGKGSPNTINPMLDAWWKTLSARLDSGPAALHRLPEAVAHVAEALWMQALAESRRRISIEQRAGDRVAQLDRERLELRSHVLTLREGEMESRIRDRDQAITNLNDQINALTKMLQKAQSSQESLTRQLATAQDQLSTRLRCPPAAGLQKPKRQRTSATSSRKAARRLARSPTRSSKLRRKRQR